MRRQRCRPTPQVPFPCSTTSNQAQNVNPALSPRSSKSDARVGIPKRAPKSRARKKASVLREGGGAWGEGFWFHLARSTAYGARSLEGACQSECQFPSTMTPGKTKCRYVRTYTRACAKPSIREGRQWCHGLLQAHAAHACGSPLVLRSLQEQPRQVLSWTGVVQLCGRTTYRCKSLTDSSLEIKVRLPPLQAENEGLTR